MLSYKIHENDTINILDKDSLKQGIWKEFWSNGDLKSEVSYKNNKKQGLEINWFDEPDCVELEAYYKDGLLDGHSRGYSFDKLHCQLHPQPVFWRFVNL